jgi:hypothetical protein
MAWTRHRCQDAPWNTTRMAARSPAWASEMTRRIFQPAKEIGPERFVFGVAHVDTRDLPMPVGTQPGGDHDRFGDHLMVLPDVDVGGVEPDVDERLMIQPAVPQHGHVDIDLRTDPRHRRLRDPRITAEGFDEVVDLAGGGAGDKARQQTQNSTESPALDPACCCTSLGTQRGNRQAPRSVTTRREAGAPGSAVLLGF